MYKKGNNATSCLLLVATGVMVSLVLLNPHAVWAISSPTLLVPLFNTTVNSWDPLIAAKEQHPSVPIVAIINNEGGPGEFADPSYAEQTQKLQSAGITVLGYTYASYGKRNSTDVMNDIENYKNWYNVNGILIDQMSYQGGDESYYSNLTSYAKSLGLSLVIGNPGVDTKPSYVGTVDAMIIYENASLPDMQSLGGWHTSYGKTNWAILPYGITSFDKSFVENATKYVGYIGMSNNTDPDTWSMLPPYLGDLVASLDPGPDSPTRLSANATSSAIYLSWNPPANNGGAPITNYEIYRGTSSGGETLLAKVGNVTSYNDTAVTYGQEYFYKVTSTNSIGESSPSDEVSTNQDPSSLYDIQSLSSTVSLAPYQISLDNFDAGSGSNSLLLVGISANSNSATSVTFNGVPLAREVSSFHNEDAEFWYMENATGTGDIVVTMGGPTSAVVGAYAFANVDQANPIPTHSALHNTYASDPRVSIATQYANDVVINLPSIYGGQNLSNPTCAQDWNINEPNAITGASSLLPVSMPSTNTCKWTASNPGLWDDVAVEVRVLDSIWYESNNKPQPPVDLSASAGSSSQASLSWGPPTKNGGSPITGYMIDRSEDSGASWTNIVLDTGSTLASYADTGLSPNTTYDYRVYAINSAGTSLASNTSSATTTQGLVLGYSNSTSWASSGGQLVLPNFNASVGSNSLLLVGISANSNSATSVTFNGVPLAREVSSFHNEDAEFWYMENATGTGDIVVTMGGPTSAVVGAYAFANVDQANPIPTHSALHNTYASDPRVSIATKYANDWVVDLPSIWGGVTLGSPTCTPSWNVTVPNEITGSSSSTAVPTPETTTCKWTASTGELWDDVAVEIGTNN